MVVVLVEAPPLAYGTTHVMKRDDTTLVMDRYWIVCHLHFLSLQDDMAEILWKD